MLLPIFPNAVYDSIIKRIERGEDVTVDASYFDISQLMVLARAAFSNDVTLRLANGPFRVEDALAVRRAGRGHVERAGPRAA